MTKCLLWELVYDRVQNIIFHRIEWRVTSPVWDYVEDHVRDRVFGRVEARGLRRVYDRVREGGNR